MAYDKTIAYSQKLFQITIPTEFATIYNCLSAEDKQKLDSICSPHTDQNRKPGTIQDGYIVSYNTDFFITYGDSGIETVSANSKYVNPVEDWVYTTQIKANNTSVGIVRILISGVY